MVPYLAIAAVLVVAFLAYQIVKPSLKRKAAVRDAVARARQAAADSKNILAQVQLARVLIEMAGQPGEALAIVERIEREHPNWWDSKEKPTKIVIGEAYVAMGQLDKAIEIFQKFVATVGDYEHGGDRDRKWRLETFKVDAEQRIRLLKKGDTHVHAPEQWGDRAE